MRDTLELERTLNNYIDELRRVQERLARLEEQVRRQATGGTAQVLEPETGRYWSLVVEDLGDPVGPVLVMEG